ncbi:EpsG family protein (plasmid) [Sphingomonas sp. CJ20]
MASVFSHILNQGQIYVLIYAYLFVAMAAETIFENERFSRNVARFSAIILTGFVGLRWETGTDWLPYFNIFYTSESSSDYDVAVFGIDQGYLILNKLVSFISHDYSTFLVLDAAISIALVYFFIEKSIKFPNMGIYLFYTSYVITHFMGSNRRMLAIGFVCVGFLVLIKQVSLRKSWWRWVGSFGFASIFHRTAIMALPGLLVSRKAWPAPHVLIGLAACVALGLSGAPFVALQVLGSFLSDFAHITVVDKLLFYTAGEQNQASAEFNVMGQAALGLLKRSTTLAIFIVFMMKGRPSEYAQRLYNIYVLGCGIYFLMIGSPVFQVVSTYYSIVEIALLPIIFHSMRPYKILYLMYLAVIPFLLMVSALSPYLQLYIPYRSIYHSY